MATSAKQDNDFMKAVMPNNFLEECIDWISKNMNPEEVFDEKELEYWATRNGFREAD